MRSRSYKKRKYIERNEKLKKSSTESCNTAYNDYITNIISPESTSNPKRFYGFIKSKKNESHGVAPLKAKTGITHSDSTTKVRKTVRIRYRYNQVPHLSQDTKWESNNITINITNKSQEVSHFPSGDHKAILNDQFSSCFNKFDDPSTIPDMRPSPYLTADNITVPENEVHKLLAGLEPHKASGPDQLPARLLKALASELAPIYTFLFQTSLDQGIIPDEWKSANVVPIYKKGDRNKPENFLTSIKCKVSKKAKIKNRYN